VADIVERLTATRFSGRFTMGGGSISSDPAKSKTSWGGERIMELVNPDGQSAAAEITVLRATVEELTRALEKIARYKHRDPWGSTAAAHMRAVARAALDRLVDRAAGP
jgi:hypothetical protein